ncbi:hypothetical protein PybrP1_012155 [[Pythium] brassicae (nom. inval.)]|nr:hypothetical protein PybrP1_012155 [[Pythium] brassicae (nom. inval.)]
MRGVEARVTSCIGGKEEKFAVQVQPQLAPLYFAYKSLRDFDALWSAMEELTADIKQRRARAGSAGPWEPSMFAKWMESFVDHYAFRATIQQLREQEKETMSTLNVFLQVVLRRVSGLYVEDTILRCGCCDVARKLALLVRSFLEFAPGVEPRVAAAPAQDQWLGKRQLSDDAAVRPECDPREAKRASAPLFPARGDRSPKARKLSSMGEFCIPTLRKVGLDAPSTAVPTRRRVFAEVDF